MEVGAQELGHEVAFGSESVASSCWIDVRLIHIFQRGYKDVTQANNLGCLSL